jgi:hypothetical protein
VLCIKRAAINVEAVTQYADMGWALQSGVTV